MSSKEEEAKLYQSQAEAWLIVNEDQYAEQTKAWYAERANTCIEPSQYDSTEAHWHTGHWDTNDNKWNPYPLPYPQPNPNPNSSPNPNPTTIPDIKLPLS